MRALFRFLLLLVVAIGLTAAIPAIPDFLPADDADRAAWRNDLTKLENHLAVAYANFQWTAAARQLDLPALHATADSALAAASNRHAARRAFRTLVAAFDDGHLRVSPPDHPIVRLATRAWRGSGAPIEGDASAASACRRMGFDREENGFGLAFDEMAGYTPIASAPFRAGIVQGPGGERVGVLRIAAFGEDRYAAACETVWNARAAVEATPCDGDCQDAIWEGVSRSLVASLAATLERIEAAGARSLIVDVTGNGGGSGLADALARELTPVALQGGPVGIIRHPHPLTSLRQQDSVLSAELGRSDLAVAQRSMLESARARISATIREVETPCDLSGMWKGEPVSCRQLVVDGSYSTGVLPYARTEDLAGLRDPSSLFHPASYGYREGVYTGRVIVVMDHGSASATEQFAALLRDNNAATIMGERSYGAGCGYTNGGVRLELASVQMTLRAPDCARLRASGENERAGIEPDVPLAWKEAGARERAALVLEAAAAPPQASNR